MSGFVDSIFEQTFKRHPYLFLFVLICSGATIAYAHNTFADQHQFKVLDGRINKLEKTVEQRFTEQRIHGLESEIYELERITSGDDSRPRDHRRLVDLKSQLGDAERNIEEIIRTND